MPPAQRQPNLLPLRQPQTAVVQLAALCLIRPPPRLKQTSARQMQAVLKPALSIRSTQTPPLQPPLMPLPRLPQALAQTPRQMIPAPFWRSLRLTLLMCLAAHPSARWSLLILQCMITKPWWMGWSILQITTLPTPTPPAASVPAPIPCLVPPWWSPWARTRLMTSARLLPTIPTFPPSTWLAMVIPARCELAALPFPNRTWTNTPPSSPAWAIL